MNSESVESYWLAMYCEHGSVRLYLLLQVHPANLHHARLLLSHRNNRKTDNKKVKHVDLYSASLLSASNALPLPVRRRR